MSNLDFDMVGREPFAFHDFVPSWSPPFDDQNIAEDVSKRLEKVANKQFSSDQVSESPKKMIRELAELLMPGQPAKIHYPRLARELGLTLRRTRSIYNGEVSRLWDDERSALRRALAEEKNSKARRAFAAAAAALVHGLSAAGHPLTYDQTSALNDIVRAA